MQPWIRSVDPESAYKQSAANPNDYYKSVACLKTRTTTLKGLRWVVALTRLNLAMGGLFARKQGHNVESLCPFMEETIAAKQLLRASMPSMLGRLLMQMPRSQGA